MSLRLLHSSCCTLMLCALALCVASPANGGTCGDYLQHAMQEREEARELKKRMDEELAALLSGQRAPTPLAPPCSGPRCRQSSPSPADLPAPSSPNGFKVRQFLIWSLDTNDLFAAGAFWRPTSERFYFFFAAEEIFHPPRSC